MTDDYTKARAKAREAEVTSNLDSDADGGNERRQRKRRQTLFCTVTVFCTVPESMSFLLYTFRMYLDKNIIYVFTSCCFKTVIICYQWLFACCTFLCMNNASQHVLCQSKSLYK